MIESYGLREGFSDALLDDPGAPAPPDDGEGEGEPEDD